MVLEGVRDVFGWIYTPKHKVLHTAAAAADTQMCARISCEKKWMVLGGREALTAFENYSVVLYVGTRK